MFAALKTWKLASALKDKAASPAAYAAVLELGRLGGDKAVELLIGALARGDGVSRSAARELGRLRDPRAIPPLAALLTNAQSAQSAAEALLQTGAAAVPALIEALRVPSAAARRLAAGALGELRDARAVEPLITMLQTDDDYAARIAAATALGQLKDSRAVWVLVGTLKLRDETTPERQAAVEQLRQAATLAMRKIGDPLTGKAMTLEQATERAVRDAEATAAKAELHPRLIGDLALLNEAELAGVMKELIAASEEISWANLEAREPMLAPYFKTYDQRWQAAQAVGGELRRRGGAALLKRVLERDLANHAAIANWWSAPA
jgi:HEAT repeat protein